MYLRVELYRRLSYPNIVLWFALSETKDGDTLHFISCELDSLLSKILWHLFVDGKEVRGGLLKFYVKMTQREGKLFKLIDQTRHKMLNKYWKQAFRRNKEEVKRELEKVIPIWILQEKISPEEDK